MNVGLPGLGQKLDLHPGQRQVVGQGRVEHAIDEDDLQPVDAVKDRRLIFGVKGCGARRLRGGQISGVGVAPVFVALRGQSHSPQPRQRVGPCRTQPATARELQPGDPCGKRIKLCLGNRHQRASARMSA